MSQNNNIEEIIEELQTIEKKLQNVLAEKQTLEAEANEVKNALTELSKTKEEVYKILGGIMVRADKNQLIKELEEKEKILSLKIKALEKQEDIITKKSDEMREKIQQSLSANKNNLK
jgi:prefoldin beta subunit